MLENNGEKERWLKRVEMESTPRTFPSYGTQPRFGASFGFAASPRSRHHRHGGHAAADPRGAARGGLAAVERRPVAAAAAAGGGSVPNQLRPSAHFARGGSVHNPF